MNEVEQALQKIIEVTSRERNRPKFTLVELMVALTEIEGIATTTLATLRPLLGGAATDNSGELLEAVKLAYRKHHLNDPNVGWEELTDKLRDALCNALDDEGFSKWIDEQIGGEPHINEAV